MEETIVNSSDANKISQPDVGEWKNEENASYNDNYEQNIVETLNDTTLNDNSVFESAVLETQENNCGFSNNENTENTWVSQNEPKNHYGNKNNSGYRKGGYNKSNNSNNSYEKSYGNDSTANNGHVRGRGRGGGRVIIKKFDEENESFRDEYGSGINNHGGNTAPGHRGRGRGYNRGRGGRRDQSGSGGWYGNSEDGLKKNENDKPTIQKPAYIPPDIENEESIAGIEAGLNFDKYKTIEVKVSGTNPPKSITSFHSSGLCTILLDNLSNCNFSTPTPVQNYAIPIIIDGRDLMASAQTGSGKTVS